MTGVFVKNLRFRKKEVHLNELAKKIVTRHEKNSVNPNCLQSGLPSYDEPPSERKYIVRYRILLSLVVL